MKKTIGNNHKLMRGERDESAYLLSESNRKAVKDLHDTFIRKSRQLDVTLSAPGKGASYYHGDAVMRFIEEFELSYTLGNVVKYIARAGKKPGEDTLSALTDAKWYLEREIENLKKQADKKPALRDD